MSRRTRNKKYIFLIVSIVLVTVLYLYIFQYEEPILDELRPNKLTIEYSIEDLKDGVPFILGQKIITPSPNTINTNINKNDNDNPIPSSKSTQNKVKKINDEDHNELNDIEFDFMQINDNPLQSQSDQLQVSNISIIHTPSPTVELPDHWINPCYQSIAKQMKYKFCDESLSFTERSNDFVSYLNNTELFRLSNAWSAELKRDDFVEIGFHDWWNEALHGLSVSSGVHYWPYIHFATQFPQVIAIASSFNRKLWYKIANVISTEARVYSNYNQSYLTFWSPNINIFRDPRW